ncbi:MAG: TIGR00269 family protein [Candidatus Bathyarchaeota archaeon]|uniref:TIGR00269 family protein n=2 Tax=Candidatus Bathycorpusculum sp. TaxID=2994959 RepID=UPI00282A90F4|nr:TIGR00269 family protein [Candidatus Termiticorpusculum sp.]MCL2291855.1 TIGR00269 family protein [Candidatus Termiticorpusculum sp.]
MRNKNTAVLMSGSYCSVCKKKPSFFYRKYSGQKLCKKCFSESIEAKVRATITKYSMLKFDDKLAIAVSGGKDSLSLLHILAKLQKYRPKTSLTAITIDEGIKGYRDEALDIAEKNCNALQIPLYITSFKELFGLTLDELIIKLQAKGKTELTPCAYCGVLRRRAINVAARNIGATKIATAHTLDDETQTVLMNILRGDTDRLSKEKPITNYVHSMFIRKIKPFCEIPENESALYAYIKKITFQDTPCPYASEALRNDIRTMLNNIEEKHTGTKFAISRTMEKLQPAIEQVLTKKDFKTCKDCGEPTSQILCKTCEMLHQIR